MHTPALPAHDQPFQAIGELLTARGFALDDFAVEQDPSPQLRELFGLVGGVMVVRRLSSGTERVYAAGAGSAWYGALAADIDAGHFGPSPRAGAAADSGVGAPPGLIDLG